MKFTFSSVIKTCASILRKSFWTIFLTSLANWAVSFVLGMAVISIDFLELPETIGFNLSLALNMLASAFALAVYMCAATDIALSRVADRPAHIGLVLRRALLKAFPALLIGIIWYLGLLLGFLLLIVPGIIFGVMSAVILPVFIEEKRDLFDNFSRSRALTKGHRWGIFAMNLLVALGLSVVFNVGRVAFEILAFSSPGEGPAAIAAVVAAIIYSICVMIFLPVWTVSIYVVLRSDKGEPLSGNIEKVFE